MTTQEYIEMIAYKEGSQAYRDNVSMADNPYDGVNVILANHWDQAWWDMFYSE